MLFFDCNKTQSYIICYRQAVFLRQLPLGLIRRCF